MGFQRRKQYQRGASCFARPQFERHSLQIHSFINLIHVSDEIGDSNRKMRVLERRRVDSEVSQDEDSGDALGEEINQPFLQTPPQYEASLSFEIYDVDCDYDSNPGPGIHSTGDPDKLKQPVTRNLLEKAKHQSGILYSKEGIRNDISDAAATSRKATI
jgi:hypothetical protein